MAEPAVTEPAVTEPAVTEPAVTEPAVTGRAAAGRAAAEPVRALFDAKAATWTAKYAPGGALTARRARLAAAVSARAGHGERVLDLGCGSGDLARHLAEAGLRVTGCDISARMLEQAERADPAGTWVTLDPAWRELPFAAGAFSAVIASSVLEYVSDPAAVLRECARVLTPGGALLCTVPDIRHPVRWLEWLAARCAAPVAPLLAPRSAAASGGPVRGSRLRSYIDRVTVGVSGAGRVRGGQRRAGRRGAPIRCHSTRTAIAGGCWRRATLIGFAVHAQASRGRASTCLPAQFSWSIRPGGCGRAWRRRRR